MKKKIFATLAMLTVLVSFSITNAQDSIEDTLFGTGESAGRICRCHVSSGSNPGRGECHRGSAISFRGRCSCTDPTC